MLPERTQVLNYSTHAIADLLEDAERLTATGLARTAVAMHTIAELLQVSVKFILPDRCSLLGADGIKQAHFELMRLPFPCVALEVPWSRTPDDVLAEDGRGAPTKMVVLCVDPSRHELSPGLNNSLENAHPQGGVCIVPLFWKPETQRWEVTFGGAFIPYDSELKKRPWATIDEPSRLATLQEDGSFDELSPRLDMTPFLLMDEPFAAYVRDVGTADQAWASIVRDCSPAISCVLQACAVVNCANVEALDVIASPALNKKRMQAGKQPFFSYKILQLSGAQSKNPHGAGGGTHASPRMHLRRGHLRRLDARVVWVRPSAVNAGSTLGSVVKDYAVVSPAKNSA